MSKTIKQWYVFEYRAPGGPKASGNSHWSHPKAHFGPFRTRDEANDQIDVELRGWRQGMRDDFGALTKKEDRDMRDHFRLRQLTDAQFKKAWGGPLPGSPRSSTSSVATDVNRIVAQHAKPKAKAKAKHKKGVLEGIRDRIVRMFS
jgi:hypothetical protein